MDFDPKDYTGLVQRTARSLHRDRPSVRASLELDDLVQELWIVWMEACKHFDPERGFTFKAYFTRCASHFAEKIGRKSDKYRSAVGDDPRQAGEDGELPEVVSQSLDAETQVMRSDLAQKALAKADGRVRRVIELLDDSSEPMRREDAALRAKAAYARSRGIARTDTGVTLSDMFTLVGLERSRGYRLIAGFKETINELNG